MQRIADTARCLVSFPLEVSELEDGSGWEAGEVYDMIRPWEPGLKAAIEANYEAYLDAAIRESEPVATLDDVVDAINELAEIVLGGE